MEFSKLVKLLIDVKALIEKYDKIAEGTGEHFNIFQVLGLTTNEVRTHSAFIAEMLNSKGLHKQSDRFFKLFIKEVSISFNTAITDIKVEKKIGLITPDGLEGGTIDIIISNNSQVVIIENKIHAADQSNQLQRYFNYAKKINKEFFIFYLTLDGKDASQESKGLLKEGVDYYKISYKETIINWLMKCKKEVDHLPILRENISQYIYLIKLLTNQSMDEKLNQEIIDKIINTDNIEVAMRIGEIVEDLKVRIIDHFKVYLYSLASEINARIEYFPEGERLGKRETEFQFVKDALEFKVSFVFDSDYDILSCGIVYIDNTWGCGINPLISKPEPFKEWSFVSWNEKFSGDNRLLSSIKERCEILFSEIESLNLNKITN